MRNILIWTIGVLAGAFIVLLILLYLDMIVVLAVFLGISLIIAYILIGIILFLTPIVLIPYYLLKKKSETQYYGSYDLDDFE